MQDAGILPGFAGIVVCDRYQNHFSSRRKHVAGKEDDLLRRRPGCAA